MKIPRRRRRIQPRPGELLAEDAARLSNSLGMRRIKDRAVDLLNCGPDETVGWAARKEESINGGFDVTPDVAYFEWVEVLPSQEDEIIKVRYVISWYGFFLPVNNASKVMNSDLFTSPITCEKSFSLGALTRVLTSRRVGVRLGSSEREMDWCIFLIIIEIYYRFFIFTRLQI